MTPPPFERWLAQALAEIPLRTNSLLVTLFGDAIAPRGGAVLLGSLIDLVAPLGINDRAIRTSVFRLMQENWLHATPIGRRSEYSLTDSGRRRFAHAYRRIYDTPSLEWHGQWLIVILPEETLAPAERESLRRDLQWDGFGHLAPGIYAHPGSDETQLKELLAQTDSERKVVIIKGKSLGDITHTPVRPLVEQCWRLGKLADDYRAFISRFEPALACLERGLIEQPLHHFLLRTLLIHEFRRVQLRDPQLPDALLAPDWPGHVARTLCQQLYAHCVAESEVHLESTLSTREGSLPPADHSLYSRFGGIARPRGRTEKHHIGTGAPARNRTTT